MFRRCLAAFALAIAAPAPVYALDLASIEAAAQSGNLAKPADRIRADVAWLADDARQGRATGEQGHRDAAAYVAARFKALGLKPAGSDGYLQPVPLRTSKRDLSRAVLEIGKGRRRVALVVRDDYLPVRSFRTETVAASGDLVFAGYGVVDATSDYDDYAGLDVKGKVVLIFDGTPSGLDSERRAHFASARTKLSIAAARGAAGFLLMPTLSSERQSPWERLLRSADLPAMGIVGPDGVAPIRGLEAAAFLSPAGAAKLFARTRTTFEALRTAEAASGAPKGFALGVSARLAGASIWADLSSPNVAGKIEGADPQLSSEYVVVTAHLDHIGVLPGKLPGEDAIANGALDNAMGVATMMEAAKSLASAKTRPRRSVVFVAVTAEERGLLGAEFFARYPSVAGRLVANVNLDMPLVLFPFTDIIAFGAERSSLGPVVAKAAAAFGLKVSPDPIPQEGLFTRSDHYAFVQQGVPSVFLVIGWENGGKQVFEDFLKTHYHRPSDEILLPIDYAAAARFAALNARIAAELSAAAEAPTWNKGDFFGDLYGRR